MRQETARFLLHTYTRISRIPPAITDPPTPLSEDDWGLPVYALGKPGTPNVQNNIPCFYGIKETAVITPEGLITLNLPILTCAYTDIIKKGDRVSNIQTLDGTMLVAGPVLVESVERQDPNIGGPVLIECQLREIVTLPSS